MLKILIIVGARPNFIKAAPICAEMRRRPDEFDAKIVHTGQHYDAAMSESFFKDLGLPKPEFHLDVGSASHAEQMAKIMLAFEPVVIAEKPDWVIVVGDVNSTVACALVASKLDVKVAHVEAGLRSFDRTMPEEINRIVTDSISDLLFTTEGSANENLRREGVPAEKVKFVGNVMIDSLVQHLEKANSSRILAELGLAPEGYSVLTLHRPSNVDRRKSLEPLVAALVEISKKLPIVFPVHPRTRAKIDEFGLHSSMSDSDLQLIDPLGYLDFLALYSQAKFVMTDSGGLQEETTYLGIPCLTIRDNTERPVTIEIGTNQLIAADPTNLKIAAFELLNSSPRKETSTPPLWDGKAAARICDELGRTI
jgi:UDP-N-acetylglucosamine 2-epimerase (non-hydrolysing)